MTTVPSDRSLAEVVELARQVGNAVVVTAPDGTQVAAVVPMELLDLIEDVVDGIDASEVLARIKSGEEPVIAWEEVKKELGL